MKKEQYNKNIYDELIEQGEYSFYQKEFLKNRWLHEVNWFTSSTRRSKKLYFVLGIISIISTSLTAVTVSAAAFSDYDIIKIVTVILSLSSAISIGLFSLFKPWDSWKRYRILWVHISRIILVKNHIIQRKLKLKKRNNIRQGQTLIFRNPYQMILALCAVSYYVESMIKSHIFSMSSC